MRPVPVPLTLDAPPRFLFFDIDYVLVALVGLILGIVLNGFGLGLILLGLFCHIWSRLRSGRGVNRALALSFWHLPFDVFTRVPASARRHFLG